MVEFFKLIGRDSAEIRVQKERKRSPYAAGTESGRLPGRAGTTAVRSTAPVNR